MPHLSLTKRFSYIRILFLQKNIKQKFAPSKKSQNTKLQTQTFPQNKNPKTKILPPKIPTIKKSQFKNPPIKNLPLTPFLSPIAFTSHYLPNLFGSSYPPISPKALSLPFTPLAFTFPYLAGIPRFSHTQRHAPSFSPFSLSPYPFALFSPILPFPCPFLAHFAPFIPTYLPPPFSIPPFLTFPSPLSYGHFPYTYPPILPPFPLLTFLLGHGKVSVGVKVWQRKARTPQRGILALGKR